MTGQPVKLESICTCECHNEPSMHIMACCDFTYNKHCDEHGKFDVELFTKSYSAVNGHEPTIVYKNKQWYTLEPDI